MTYVKRSGVRRICNDCTQDILPNNQCGCPPIRTPFDTKGTEVTVYAPNGRPTHQTTVARVGQGAFRTASSDTWYDIVTGVAHVGNDDSSGFVRLSKDGDKEAIETERARLKQLASAHRDLQSANDRMRGIEHRLLNDGKRLASFRGDLADGQRTIRRTESEIEIITKDAESLNTEMKSEEERSARAKIRIANLEAQSKAPSVTTGT